MEDEPPPSRVSVKVRTWLRVENSMHLDPRERSTVISLVHASSFQDKQKTKTVGRKVILAEETLRM